MDKAPKLHLSEVRAWSNSDVLVKCKAPCVVFCLSWVGEGGRVCWGREVGRGWVWLRAGMTHLPRDTMLLRLQSFSSLSWACHPASVASPPLSERSSAVCVAGSRRNESLGGCLFIHYLWIILLCTRHPSLADQESLSLKNETKQKAILNLYPWQKSLKIILGLKPWLIWQGLTSLYFAFYCPIIYMSLFFSILFYAPWWSFAIVFSLWISSNSEVFLLFLELKLGF